MVEVSKETRQLPLWPQPTQAIRNSVDHSGIDASADAMHSRQLTYATGNSKWEACDL